MTFFKSALARFHHRSEPTPIVVASNADLNSGCHRLRTEATQFVQKVDICTALTAGDDAWGTPIDENHHHTLLRVSLVGTPDDSRMSENVLLMERVLSTVGAYHSVTPIEGSFSPGGTLFHPDVHDRVCMISEGPSTAIAHDLQVERTLVFGGKSTASRLSLAQFAVILNFISRTSIPLCAGGDCKYQSRLFAFMCMSALSPTLPPAMHVRRSDEAIGMNVQRGTDPTNDSVFELAAEAFLADVPLLINEMDEETRQALQIMLALKGGPRG